MQKSSIIVALDYDSADKALALAEQLNPQQCLLKVGKSLFTRCGPSLLQALADLGHRVFLDLKYHDIPATVAGAVQAAADLNVWMVNVHASGGSQMLEAAAQALAGYHQRPLLIGVTVLTSMNQQTYQSLGFVRSLPEQVAHLTRLTMEAGLDGVVCSPLEVQAVKARFPQAVTVTPGVRPYWANQDDQSRILTPKQACERGSDFLVIGRPITAAAEPQTALLKIIEELGE